MKQNRVWWGRFLPMAAIALGFFTAAPRAGAGLVLDDPLQGSTKGIRSGGAFAAGGWKVTGAADCIIWHLGTITRGAVEWDVKGLRPAECRAGMEDKTELFHMYDYKVGDSDHKYLGGYRDNPYKHFVRKIGCIGGAVDALELVWKIEDNYQEPDSLVLSWDAAATDHFREEWGPDGNDSRLRTYRNGVLVMTMTLPGVYAPAGLSIRIAASNRGDAASGAPIDAIYSNVKAWDLSPNAPAEPVITEVVPDPELAAPGIEYARQLVLEQGNPAPAWSVLSGPPGLAVDSTGRISGWTPAASDVGKKFDIGVRAANSQGADVETWSVEVADVRVTSFPFASGAEGWALAGWKSGPYDPGTIAWDAAAGHPGGGIRASGAGASNNLDACTREGGIMTRSVSTAGLRSVSVEYDVSASLGAAPGGTAGGACPVLEGSSDDKLVVYYSTRGVGGPWIRAQTIPESELPLDWAHRTVSLAAVAAAGNNPAFAVKFQWQFNSGDDSGRIDNVRVQGASLGPRFRRGDANADGGTDLSDAVAILARLFLAGDSVPCDRAADATDDGALDISDAVAVLGFLYLDGKAIGPPAGACGLDPTDDALACEAFPACP